MAKQEDAMECASAKRALTPMPCRGIDVPMAKDAIGCAQRESQRRTTTRRAMAPSNAMGAMDCEEASQKRPVTCRATSLTTDKKAVVGAKVPSEHRSP